MKRKLWLTRDSDGDIIVHAKEPKCWNYSAVGYAGWGPGSYQGRVGVCQRMARDFFGRLPRGKECIQFEVTLREVTTWLPVEP